MNQLDDKTALITGGGRGIGRAIALQLAQRGARVAVAARSEGELVETTSAIAASGGGDELGRVDDFPVGHDAGAGAVAAATGLVKYMREHAAEEQAA